MVEIIDNSNNMLIKIVIFVNCFIQLLSSVISHLLVYQQVDKLAYYTQ